MREKLLDLGLNSGILYECENIKDKYLGRVTAEYKSIYKVSTEEDNIFAKVSGKFMEKASGTEDYPAVGDWVIVDRTTNKTGEAIISRVLPRKSAVSRKVAGTRFDEQIIAANIDYLFICMSANNDFNLRRLERYITIGWNSGAIPVVVMTKIDICHDLESIKNQIENTTNGIDVLYLSSLTSDGVENIGRYLGPGKTIAFIGSSGVGKSTLINHLLGEERMLVNDIREDDHKGKHTTTHRELIVLKGRGVLIDTPGMREIQLLDDIDGIDSSFRDITDLAKGCKFNDCEHKSEPGCAVKFAIGNGTIQVERLESYRKLLREAKYIESKNIKKGIK